MRALRRTFFLAVIFNASYLMAAHPLGLGVILFGPSGLSGKYKISNSRQVDAALGWNSHATHIHSTYLLVKPRALVLDGVGMDWFFGVGGRLRLHDDDHRHGFDDDHSSDFGARAPIGIQYQFKDPRIEVFTELSLYLNLVPGTDAGIDFGLGARYFF